MLLDLIRIAEPCTVAWSSMTGDDRSRHCGQCDKTVFDLSKLTRAEAETLVAAKGEQLCARYIERADGTIVLADCLVRRKRRRVAAVVGVAAALAGVAATTTTHELTKDVEAEVVDAEELPAELPVPSVELKEPTQTMTDELTRDEAWRFSLQRGEYLSGAISFDAIEEIQLERDKAEVAAEAIRSQLAQEKLLRDLFGEPAVEGRIERRMRERLEVADPNPGVFEDEEDE